MPYIEVSTHRLGHIPKATFDALLLRFPHIDDKTLLALAWNHIRSPKHYGGRLCCK